MPECPAGKKPEDQLFDTMDAQDLNKRLKDLMDGLSVKVLCSRPPTFHPTCMAADQQSSGSLL